MSDDGKQKEAEEVKGDKQAAKQAWTNLLIKRQ